LSFYLMWQAKCLEFAYLNADILLQLGRMKTLAENFVTPLFPVFQWLSMGLCRAQLWALDCR